MRRFHFSAKVSVVCLVLAGVMLFCARWQWQRYKFKSALMAQYFSADFSAPVVLPPGADVDRSLISRRVKLQGMYDHEHEMIVTNRQHGGRPGHWLVSPFLPSGSQAGILVSRGFIPFEDLGPEQWKKYATRNGPVTIAGVVQPTDRRTFLGPKNPAAGKELPFQRKWFFVEAGEMAKQLPYKINEEIYIQQLTPSAGEFPAPTVLIDVPPSTHFGYTIEWILLACLTLAICLGLQLRPQRKNA